MCVAKDGIELKSIFLCFVNRKLFTETEAIKTSHWSATHCSKFSSMNAESWRVSWKGIILSKAEKTFDAPTRPFPNTLHVMLNFVMSTKFSPGLTRMTFQLKPPNFLIRSPLTNLIPTSHISKPNWISLSKQFPTTPLFDKFNWLCFAVLHLLHLQTSNGLFNMPDLI